MTTELWKGTVLGISAVLALFCVVERVTPAQLLIKIAYWVRFCEALSITFVVRLVSDVRHAWKHVVAVAYADARHDMDRGYTTRERLIRRVQ